MKSKSGFTLIETLIIMAIALLITAVLSSFYFEAQENAKEIMALRRQGFDILEAEVFVKAKGLNLSDFKNSPGLQKEYQRFHDGEVGLDTTGGQLKQAKEAANSAAVMSAVAVGMSAGRR